MTFISYAQNFEDVILRRVLADVVHGFYVDVGANDPVVDSVTKAFYDAGWNGISVEPSKEWFDRLEAARPRDTNLKICVGASEGEITFFEIPETGLSTTDDLVAGRHRDSGRIVHERVVRVRRLSDVLAEHSVDAIHFLKIDVEGAERSVLEGLDLEVHRPWIVVAEATEPLTQSVTHATWEPILFDARYRFVLFDGLNRFYLAEEHAELTSRFDTPPNWFDGFKTHEVVYLREMFEATDFARRTDRDSMSARIAELDAAIERTTRESIDAKSSLERRLSVERVKRARLASLLDEVEEQRRREHRLFELLEIVARDLESSPIERAVGTLRALDKEVQLEQHAKVELRRRLRKVRRYLVTHPSVNARLGSAQDWLDRAASRLPEQVTPFASSVDMALRGESGIESGEGVPLSSGPKRRIRKLRKFLAKGTVVGERLPAVIDLLDRVSRMTPNRRPRGPRSQLLEEIADLKRSIGFGRPIVPAGPTGDGAERGGRSGAPHVLVLSTYPCVRPRHGGQIRLRGIVSAYSDAGFSVTPLAVFQEEVYASTDVGTRDVAFPEESRFRATDGRIVPATVDLATGRFAASDVGAYPAIAARIENRFEVIHVEQPWLFPLVSRLVSEHAPCRGARVVYGSQNIEVDLKRSIFATLGVDALDVLDDIAELERDAVVSADLSLAVTQADLSRLESLGARRVVLAPNGISPWHARESALEHWRERLPDAPFALYVASAHPPNFDGFIASVGDSLACIPPNTKLVIAGGVGPHLEDILGSTRWSAINRSRLLVLGVLDEVDLVAVKSLAHVFVLPILDGGGSNIKTAEAIYSKKHVVATRASLRGFEGFVEAAGIRVVDSAAEFQSALRDALCSPLPEISDRDNEVREELTWERSLERIAAEVIALLAKESTAS